MLRRVPQTLLLNRSLPRVAGRRLAPDLLVAILLCSGAYTPGADKSDSSPGPDFVDRESRIRSFQFVWREDKQSFRHPGADALLKELESAKTPEEKAVAQSIVAATPMRDENTVQIVELSMDGERIRFATTDLAESDTEGEGAVKGEGESGKPRSWDHLEVFNGQRTTTYFRKFPPGPTAFLYDGNRVPDLEYVGAIPIVLTVRPVTWARGRMDSLLFDPTNRSNGIQVGRRDTDLGKSEGGESRPFIPTLRSDFKQRDRILREIYTQAERASRQSDIVYQEHEEFGAVPESWTHTMYYSDRSVRQIIRAKVLEYRLNPDLPDDTFAVPLAPGTSVFDGDARFAVAADGSLSPVTTPEK